MEKKITIIMITIFLITVLCPYETFAWSAAIKGVKEVASKVMKIGNKVIVKKGAKKLSFVVARRSAKNFGKRNIKYLDSIPKADLRRLNAYAGKAGDQATKDTLISYYKKGGADVLNKISWKEITATGLSVSMIVSAYQVSDGVQEGMVKVANNSPEVFENVCIKSFNRVTAPFVIGLTIFLTVWSVIYLFFYYKKKKNKYKNKYI